MMKRNYLGKAMAVVAMLLVGLSFTSCDEKDNALIINGKEWVKSEVIKTDGGATIVANSPSEVSRMLMKVAADLNAAVMAGEDFVIIIDAPSLEASEGDFTVSLPLYNNLSATNDAKVVVNFANSLSTDVPLRIEAKGATGGAITAQNKVEINLPSGTSGIDLDLYMPETSVTLNGGNIDELIAITAPNTLNIESGVTVNWLMTKGGNVAVKDGGKVLGFLFDTHFYVSKAGIYGNVFKDEVPEGATNADDYYYVQKGKIIKSEDGSPVSIIIEGSDEEQKNIPEIIISDGVYAWVDNYTDPYNNNYLGKKNAAIINITGEGNATMMPWGADWGAGFSYWVQNRLNLDCVNNLANVTIDYSKAIDFNYGAYDKFVEVDEDGMYGNPTVISLPLNSENCTFITKNQINGCVKDGVMSKVTSCTLTTPYKSNGGGGSISHVEAVNSKLTGTYMNYISGNSENSTFTCNMIDFNNDRYSGNTATVKNCKFESSTENSSPVRVGVPFQTESRSSFSMNFENCSFPKSFMFRTWVDANKPVYDDKGVETGTEPAYYKGYQINMVFAGSTIDGKAITKDNFVIGIISDGYDENNEVATTSRIIIDDVSYKAVKDPDTQKWSLTAAE
jgi:hypothetical protein